ncbi:MAG: hypothetical protein H0T77_05055 [Pyrinomonadaceae bacterium]|nr:hypothetical protein [Pyrinomonadaceae bacterium]
MDDAVRKTIKTIPAVGDPFDFGLSLGVTAISYENKGLITCAVYLTGRWRTSSQSGDKVGISGAAARAGMLVPSALQNRRRTSRV